MAKQLARVFFLTAVSCASRGEDPQERREAPLAIPAGGAAAMSRIDAAYLRSIVAEFASDAMEGRAPGTPGDRRARAFLARELDRLGCERAAGLGGWEQRVPLVGLTAHMPELWTFRAADGRETTLRWRDDYIAAAGVPEREVGVEGSEIVFVGYGIQAPEEGWDDFKGAPLRGKTLLMLNDDPDWDPELFGGERRLYYGRWTAKYESAARQGAAGAIIIHTAESAGYPWSVVQTSWAGEQCEVPGLDEPTVKIKAWLSYAAAQRLVALAHFELVGLIEKARSRDFRPIPLGLQGAIRFTVSCREAESANVVGLLRGRDVELSKEVVIFTAHHDHLGIGPADASGDTVYNGAIDNGVAVAQALAVARAFAALPEMPRRSVLFLFVAAEEQGLLGSRAYTQHPIFPLGQTVANINFELGNVWGLTRDVTIHGMGKSTLEEVVAAGAATQGRTVGPELAVRDGWYYRSDQFSFARVGVPAVWFRSGTDFVDRPREWGKACHAEWIATHYHRPSDEVDPNWDYAGLVQDAQLAFLVGWHVAETAAPPAWYPGDEFASLR
ncbi:MAG: M28 family peptidase [Planctomycetota bacterium]